MATLRWTVQKLGKDNIVARTNAAYGIPDRVYVTNISKAKELGMEQLERIRHPVASKCRCAYRLPSACAVKPRSRSSRRGRIGATRCCSRIPGTRAGGKSRFPIRTAEQRQLLDEAKALAKRQELGRTGLRHLPRLPAAFPLRMRAGRNSRLPRASASLRARALSRTDRLGVPGARRTDVEATHAEAERDRSRGPRRRSVKRWATVANRLLPFT